MNNNFCNRLLDVYKIIVDLSKVEAFLRHCVILDAYLGKRIMFLQKVVDRITNKKVKSLSLSCKHVVRLYSNRKLDDTKFMFAVCNNEKTRSVSLTNCLLTKNQNIVILSPLCYMILC